MLMQTVQPTLKPKRLSKRRKPVDPATLEEIKKLGGLGLTLEQLCNYYCMSVDTWNKRLLDFPEIELAYRSGRAAALERVTGKLWEKIEQGNLSAIIFYLKTQGRWREVDREDEFGNMPGERKHPKITLTVHDPIEASKIYQQIMKGS